MIIQHRVAFFVALAVPGAAMGQQPSASDANRQPVYQQPAISPNSFDNGRLPVLQGAGSGTGLNVQSFPAQSAVGPVQTQPYSNSRPVLSPYLNLFRGGNVSGLGGIDYFNFVRPAQQAEGAFIGRQPGQMAFDRFGRGTNLDPSEDGLTPSARPAGTPAAFMNTGGYFNRMGSIGLGVRQPQQSRTGGNTRRR